MQAQALTSLRKSTRAALCAECGKCTAVCPLAASGGFSARVIACQHLEEEIEGHGLGIKRCLTCGSCDLRCPQGVHFTQLVRSLREVARDESFESDCPHGGALLSIMRLMSQGKVKQDRLGWLTDDLKTDPEKGEVFYWTGCTPYYDAFFTELEAPTVDASRAAVRLLNALGITPVVSPEERCCGHDLLWNGDREGYERLAKHNVELVARSGATMLVTSCAECLRTWKIDYEEFLPAKRPRILHISELLAERMGELKLEGNGTRKVTFQDPCRLGRHLGIYEPPRQVLAALPGVELAEMTHSQKSARCCAGGSWAHCDRFAKQIQVERLHEARASGAEVMVTACPKCRIHFDCAMRDEDARDGAALPMRDLAEVVAEALERGPRPTVQEKGGRA
jgi:heterodisulfide reductase subunit D